MNEINEILSEIMLVETQRLREQFTKEALAEINILDPTYQYMLPALVDRVVNIKMWNHAYQKSRMN